MSSGNVPPFKASTNHDGFRPCPDHVSSPARLRYFAIAGARLRGTAKLNRARSRALPTISSRTLMDQTCRGRGGRFCPTMCHLFHAARTGRRAGKRSMDMGLPPAHRTHPSSVFRRCQQMIKMAACPPTGRERTFLEVTGNGEGWGSRKVQAPPADFSGHLETWPVRPLASSCKIFDPPPTRYSGT
jgi:hypothetical protein